MTFSAPGPEAEKELASIRKAVDGLRNSLANHKPPEALGLSDPAVCAVAEAHDEAMADLESLGFKSLGDSGQRLNDGSVAVARWFCDSEGWIPGWLGFITTRAGPRLVVFMVTEAPGPSYCTSLRGAPTLSLALPPHENRSDYEVTVTLAGMLNGHHQRVNSLTTGDFQFSRVTSLDESLELVERLHYARMAWRASCDPQELLRADLRSVLANQYRKMRAEEFWLIYSHAAEWLDFPEAR